MSTSLSEQSKVRIHSVRVASWNAIADPTNGGFDMLSRPFPIFAFACALFGVLALTPSAANAAAAYDLAPYQTMAKEVLELVTAGSMEDAKKKVGQLEAKWDGNNLRDAFPAIDQQMDAVKDAVNSGDAKKSTAELNRYVEMIDKTPKSARVVKPMAVWTTSSDS
jgi:hypothetical protein